ncbi:MAG: hypothetical protein RJB13_2136, partial [Pseudomonadota bacterium]
DVLEALLLFKDEEKHFRSLCAILQFYTDSDELFKKLIDFQNLSNENIILLIEHCMLQRNVSIIELCKDTFDHKIRDHFAIESTSSIFSVWLRASLCIESEPLSKLSDLFEIQLNEKAWHPQNKIELINAFVNATLMFHHGATWSKKQVSLITQLLDQETHEAVLGRWLRALGEANLTFIKLPQSTLDKIKSSTALQSSSLLMMNRMSEHHYNNLLIMLCDCEIEKNQNLGAFLRACAKLKTHDKVLPKDETLERALKSKNTEDVNAALTFLARHPRQQFLQLVNELSLQEKNSTTVVVHAVVTARKFRSEASVESMIKCLHSSSKVIAGRALDTLLVIDSNAARLAVIGYLSENQSENYIVDKVLRSIKLPKNGDEATADLLDRSLVNAQGSPLFEELSQLASNLRSGLNNSTSLVPSTDVIKQIDEFLSNKISDFLKLPDPIKASLRSAEIPHKQPELFEGSVDKSASVVQYCKAIDLTLEREFGQKTLFPKLERQLHVFQNILHKAGLDQENFNTGVVMRQLGIEHLFEAQSFPALKMKIVARSILTGKILRERAQVIDGLKAWAVLLLLFSGYDFMWGKPVSPDVRLKFQSLAQKLISLQDLRNPAAHRQTMLTLAPLSEIRKDVFSVFSSIQSLF